MKRFAALTISGLIVVSALTGCGSQTVLDTNVLLEQTPVEAAAFGSKTLSMNKDDSKEIKNSTLKINEKKESLNKKTAEKLVIKFSVPSKNALDERDIANISRFTLNSMNQAGTWSEGYKIGVQALGSMASQGVYVARVSYAAAEATKDWQNGYKVVAAALNHIASGQPNDPRATCNLSLNMMAAANTWSDGYRVGYAAMQVIAQTDNQSVRYITDLALRQAGGTSDWQDGFNVLRNAFVQLRNSF